MTPRQNAKSRATATTKNTSLSASLDRWFYQKNKKFLEHPVNRTFEDVLWMTDREFQDWMAELRRVILHLWDNEGFPPTVGLSKNEIIEQFEQIHSFPVAGFLREQVGKPNQKVIRNTSKVGSAANQWFPTMMKTRINYTSNLAAGLSIYDHIKKEDLFGKMVTYGRRHFKRDSFYNYSYPVPHRAADSDKYLFCCNTGREWILKFEAHAKQLRQTHDYWICPKKENAKYTGYDDKLRSTKYLTITKAQLKQLPIPRQCKTNVSSNPKTETYQIHVFEKGQRLFPKGFKVFRVSVCQSAVNFPPLTAKFIYERYLEKLGVQKAIIWDPSAGWGGRILGAMGVHRQFSVHYIGTDPNTDHDTKNGRTKYHELADFYNEVRTGKRKSQKKWRRRVPTVNTYEIYQCGSEVMHEQPAFKKYKGKIDIVFTSPPYFGKELYSKDPTQSAIKFDKYRAWRDGFLRQTLKTAVEWLRPGGYLAWNIADIELGNKRLPLEDDSCRILRDLGMNRVEILNMALAQMPGANRVKMTDATFAEETAYDIHGAKTVRRQRGTILAPHGCWLKHEEADEIPIKYEPIYIYQKPAKKGARAKEAIGVSDDSPTDMAMVVSDMAAEFKRAISGPKINPNWLRAIYSGLEKRSAGKNRSEFYSSFNRCRKNDFFITEKSLEGAKTGVPQFVQRKAANGSRNRLVGKPVLVQFWYRDNRGKVERCFAYADVLKPELGDDKRTVWVKISNRKGCAERCAGLTMELRRWDVLTVKAAPSPFVAKKGQWQY